MLEELKERVYRANIRLVEYGLVVLTWGNVSAVSDDRRHIVIKPSGVDYSLMQAGDMVVTDMEGNVVEGELRPSSDLPTHAVLYRRFPGIFSAVHTHSRYATALAQAERDLPCYGTTHADTFYGPVPCTRPLTDRETAWDYEKNTGEVLADTFEARSIDPLAVPGALVCKHGPFTWGTSCEKAVQNALILEECARMALMTERFEPGVHPAPQPLMDKHYYRKHGAAAYYGQE